MCFITKLICNVCGSTDKYCMKVCDDFKKENKPRQMTAVPAGKHFHCPSLKWPLEPSEDITHDICEQCLAMGRSYYTQDRMAKIILERKAQNYLTHMRARYGTGTASSDDNEDEQLSDPVKRGHESLPPSFSKLHASTKLGAVNTYNSTLTQGYDEWWKQRHTQLASRNVTLWLPCCPICELPTLEEHNGIADVEFEPNSTLWQWMHELEQNAAPVQTNISTGFMIKVCEQCIADEWKTRDMVRTKLEHKDCTKWDAWSIHYWMLCRGIGNIPYNEVAVPNLGVPDKEPPSVKASLELLSESWKRMSRGTHLAFWWDVKPCSHNFPCTIHPELLLRLDQWNDFINPGSEAPVKIRDHRLARPNNQVPESEASVMDRDHSQVDPQDHDPDLPHLGSRERPIACDSSSESGESHYSDDSTVKELSAVVTFRGLYVKGGEATEVPAKNAFSLFRKASWESHDSETQTDKEVVVGEVNSAPAQEMIPRVKKKTAANTSDRGTKHAHDDDADNDNAESSEAPGNRAKRMKFDLRAAQVDEDNFFGNMEDGLNPNEAFLKRCNCGCWHLIDAVGTEPGYLVSPDLDPASDTD